MPFAQRLFPRFRVEREHRPRAERAPAGPSLGIRWLGTAGHVITAGDTTVLLDPFVTRPGLRGLARPLAPDAAAIERWIPRRVDAVLVGHSHYDHLLDAPAIALDRGARLVGSETTLALARATGVPEDQLDLVPPTGRTLRVGSFEITFVPSLHGRIFFGRVPLPGSWSHTPPLPLPAWRYRMGGAFGILIRASANGDPASARTVYHNGSADLVDVELAGRHADVLLLGLAGRRATPDYLSRVTGALGPRVVIPTHHDAFFGPLEAVERLLPGIDMRGFYADVRSCAPDARIVTPLYRDDVVIPLEGDPRDVSVIDARGLG